MIKYVIGRAIGGVDPNGFEYILDIGLLPKTFDSKEDAKSFLIKYEVPEDSVVIQTYNSDTKEYKTI